MLIWLRSQLDRAGLANVKTISAVGVLLGAASLAALLVNEAIGIPALSLAIFTGLIGVLLEWLVLSGRKRSRAIAEAWPQITDSLLSGVSSGLSIAEAFEELADTGPAALRKQFRNLREDLDFGTRLSVALRKLKAEISDINGDRLIELSCLASDLGGEGLIDSLRTQSQLARQEVALSGEIESRLGWVTSTAKIAILTPWLIVAMLSTRPENLQAYASPEGSILLTVGLVVSLFAFRLILHFGAAPKSPRVFS